MSFLFGGNPIDELVDKATSENLPIGSEDMVLNLEIADKIKSKNTPANYAAKSIKRRLLFKNPNVQILAMKLADTCAKNSGSHFLVEVASRDFMDTLVSIGGSLQLTDLAARKAALALIQNWGLSFKGKPELSYACEVYETLKREGVPFPPVDRAEVSSVMIDTTTAPEWTESDVCMRCRTQFTTFNRKHHCRNCGQTFCHACSSKNVPLPHLGITDPVRVCDGCNMKMSARAAGGASPAPVRNESVRYKDVAAQREQDDLERAIAASLALSGGAGNGGAVANKPAVKKAQPAPTYNMGGADEEEDEDLKAAIEASLRDLKVAEDVKSGEGAGGAYSYGNAAAGGGSGGAFAGFGGYADQAPSAAALLTPLPSSQELSRIEIDNLKLFADLVEKMEADVQQRGIGVMSHSQISDLYTKLFALQPKLQWSLDDAVSKYRKSMDMNERVSDSLQMYDRLMQERLISRGSFGAPPQQQYWGTPQQAPGQGYYAAGVPATYPQQSAPPQQAYSQYGTPPQQQVPGGYAVPQQGWGPAAAGAYAPPAQQAPPSQQFPSDPNYQYSQAPPSQQPHDGYQQQQQFSQASPIDAGYAPHPQQGYNPAASAHAPSDPGYAPQQGYPSQPQPTNQAQTSMDQGYAPQLQQPRSQQGYAPVDATGQRHYPQPQQQQVPGAAADPSDPAYASQQGYASQPQQASPAQPPMDQGYPSQQHQPLSQQGYAPVDSSAQQQFSQSQQQQPAPVAAAAPAVKGYNTDLHGLQFAPNPADQAQQISPQHPQQQSHPLPLHPQQQQQVSPAEQAYVYGSAPVPVAQQQQPFGGYHHQPPPPQPNPSPAQDSPLIEF
ncbi:hypothetical protein BC830DRAFT_1093349 [Chytriomyces sp. MP71]|nr:hypothetical protein BC830DRAFT_1093349 [Chytriomyces sp. MP71]